jgi:simple sugar transport system permease protein
MYAALGETISERAGVVNLGVEGAMLIGAAVSALVAWHTTSAWLGLFAGALAAGIFNLGLAVLAVTRRANQLASGLTMGFLGIGVSALIGKSVVGQMITGFEAWPVPGLSAIPVIGPVLFDHDLLVYLVVPIAILIWWALFRTRWGLHLRAVGEDLTVAYAAGLKPAWLQYQAVFLGGLLAGMGGVQLALSYAGVWNEGITAGRGFIAVALVIFAGWNPLRVVLGALLFGGALAFQLQLQARGAPISPFFLDMIPYLLTLGALLFFRKGRRSAMPAGLKSVLESSQ